MSLQYVLQELDRELVRLEALRKIMVSLSHTPAAVQRVLEPASKPSSKLKVQAPAASDTAAPAAKPQRKPRTDAGWPRGRRLPKPTPVERALTSTVPSGPVLFNPSHLAQERARQEAGKEPDPTPEPQETSSREDLDAQSRSLAARWSTGVIQ